VKKQGQLIVERDEAETYVFLSLVAFGATVILVRLFLELAGYPQVGSSTLHIAHLLWGGLLLFAAVQMVLIWDNPGALTLAAVLSGAGIGLFIDEVGKFITQNNDYFFPAAAPIIYGFFLLTVVLYVYVRRPDEDDPRRGLVSALEELQDAVYGEMDAREVHELLANLDAARQSERPEIRELARVLHAYVEQGNVPFKDYAPSFLRRIALTAESWGQRLGQRRHRLLILAGLVVIAFSALLTFATLIWVAISPSATTETFLADLAAQAERFDVSSVRVQYLRVTLQAAVGAIALAGFYFILQGQERRGLQAALVAVMLSATALQLLTFYLDQFTAVIPTLFQFGVLLLILQYRRWYLSPDRRKRLQVERRTSLGEEQAPGPHQSAV
jgi:hypothetical protein